MMATARSILERLKNPRICYTINSIDLFKRTMEDFDKFGEGGLARIIDKTNAINVDARIIEVIGD